MHAATLTDHPVLAPDSSPCLPTAAWRCLTRADHAAVVSHLVGLDVDDRRLRFGQAVSDDMLQRYAESLWRPGHAVLGVLQAGRLLAMGHLASDERYVTAEIGLSVSADARNRGLGSLLLDGALGIARAWGVRHAEVHYRSSNRGMARLCAPGATRIEAERGECVATYVLAGGTLPPQAMSTRPPALTATLGSSAPRRRRHWAVRAVRRTLRWTLAAGSFGQRRCGTRDPNLTRDGLKPKSYRETR